MAAFQQLVDCGFLGCAVSPKDEGKPKGGLETVEQTEEEEPIG